VGTNCLDAQPAAVVVEDNVTSDLHSVEVVRSHPIVERAVDVQVESFVEVYVAKAGQHRNAVGTLFTQVEFKRLKFRSIGSIEGWSAKI
jgi:hypothetical protein